jgi:pre-rRNA-processing protein TSR4
MSRPSTPTSAVPSNAQVSSIDEDDPSSASIKDSFESSLDKPFMRFSTRLAHNPEQVIRYEFKGKPLLYSTSDAVGKLLVPRSGTGVNVSSGIPRCTNCGSARVFEVQLVPHAITMLEEDEQGVGLGEGGMEWGTVILGVCGKDCPERGKEAGEVGYVEEWAGVQWEEQMSKK